MLSQRGQESAPFELLIAMILMGFVLVVGFNALDKLNFEICKGNMNQSMEQIRTAIETVVKNKSKANVGFELPGCFREDESKLRILTSEEPAYCSAYCGGGVQSCKVLTFYNPLFSDTKCLRISQVTTFPSDDPPCNPGVFGNPDEYETVEWENQQEGISGGQYTLKAEFNLFSGTPEVCVYRRR
ncbi:MAG TPA: hypothetical protein VJH23_03315 [archaeon]|nr:hypothetical protein [archaeon]